ncbi:MAG TPA: hypothetical protein VGS57_16470 [Thermoanaerobaculia bacterium]|jgi:photosystem II stability/assembly factor-like uncharacterized protein|nr:hypothetical protein [Thermoanaerobaculia bacterium]
MSTFLPRCRRAVWFLALAAGLVPGLALSRAAIAESPEDERAEADNATLRRIATDEWYNETSTHGHGPKSLGGPFSPRYMRFLNEAAARERQRWGALLPQGDGQVASEDAFEKAAATGNNWISLGPTKADVEKNGSSSLNVSDSGRVRSILPDPSSSLTLYVAFAAGGVWKTTDGGVTWQPKTESLGTLSCGSLAMDPSNSSTLYLGLGDPFDGTGIGLVKTTDGGNTWSAPVYLGSSTVIPQVMVAPTNPAIVLAATDKGLFRSTDSGASFSQVAIATGQAGAPYVWSIASTGGTGLVLTLEANPTATTGTTDGQVWWSLDNGASWTRATGVTKSTGVGRMTVAAAPSSPSTLYLEAAIPLSSSASDLADFFKSTNGGQSWTALSVTKKRYSNANTESRTLATLLNGQGWYDQMVIVDPANANRAWFGGALLMAKTTDGGSSYSQASNWLAQFGLPYIHADFHAASFGPDGSFYVGSDGGLFKSSDGGTTWTSNLNVGITTHLLYSVGSTPANTTAVIGGFQDNGTRVRSGATSTFNQYVGGDGFGSDINRTNGNTMLGSLYYARIQKSTNGGTSFTQSCSGITECGTSNAPFLTKVVAWSGDPTGNTVYTSSNTKIYKSTNYAGSWSALGTSGLAADLQIRNLGVANTSSSVLGIAGTAGRIYLSSNGGASWTLAATPPNNGLSMSWVHFDTSNSQVVYIASVAPDATKTHLWKSTNFGASWTSLEGSGFPTGIPVNTIENDPGDVNTLYAGTHMGIYRSTDGGVTWTRFGAGMPLVNVTDLYVSPTSSLVRAASYGRGFWELTP